MIMYKKLNTSCTVNADGNGMSFKSEFIQQIKHRKSVLQSLSNITQLRRDEYHFWDGEEWIG